MSDVRLTQLLERLEKDRETLRQLGTRFQTAFDNGDGRLASEISEEIKNVLITIPFEIRDKIVNNCLDRLPYVPFEDQRWSLLLDLKFKLCKVIGE